MTQQGPVGTFLEYVRTKDLRLDLPALRAYLDTVVKEDANAEFKAATGDTDFQIRKAAASLGNRSGGEIFVGVSDPTLEFVGTKLTEDQLRERLRQPAISGAWYSTDPSLLVIQTRAIELTHDSGKRVIVAEIRKGLLPTLVVDKTGAFGDVGGLVWFRRDGRVDRRLTGFEGVEATREYARGRLLVALYREYQIMTRSIPWTPPWGAPVGRAYFSLPLYEGSRADGSFYTDLEADDRDILLARPAGDPNSQWSPGLLPRIIGIGERLDQSVAEFQRLRAAGLKPDWERDVGNNVRVAAEDAKRDLEQFSGHLQRLGLLPAEKK